jgi:DNA-binding LytR/AlgR family response regulator
MKYTCLLVDDEYLALDLLEKYIDRIPFLEVAGKINKPSEVLDFMQKKQVDILFLDIEMPEMIGTQLLRMIEQKPVVIFTTAHREYAFEGYDFGIADYLLKPIRWERFKQAVDKAKIQVQAKTVNHGINKKDTITVSSGDKKEFVLLTDIVFIKASKDYSIIHTQAKKHVVRKNLGQLHQLLPDNNFIRVHKSYLVPLDKIQLIKNNFLLIHDHKVPIGRKYKRAVSDALE